MLRPWMLIFIQTTARVLQRRQPVKNVKTNYTDKQNTLEIPKISISVPIVFATAPTKILLQKTLIWE